MVKSVLVALLGGAAIAAPAIAGAGSASGSAGGLSWTATSTIVGQSSTGTVSGGGSAIYTAAYPGYSGVVGLLMDYGAGGQFVCSGTLLGDRRSIVTAGHCVSEGAGTSNPISTTAYFRAPGSNAETVVYSGGPTVATAAVSEYFVDPDYTGEVIDQNDIAVLRLAQDAPAFATSYSLYGSYDLTGKDFTVAGYGLRSQVGGSQGYTGSGAGAGVGRFRDGDNRYDFALGDADFDGFFDGYFGSADTTYSYLSDFDNGLAANDASCILGSDFLGGAASKYCDLGLGAREASTAGGDSGGPGFINGQLATISSYGLTFGTDFGDYKCPNDNDCLQSSWGEFNGFVPVALHKDFILSAMVAVPEPSSWGLIVVGFGAVGAAARRRRAASAAA